MTWTNADAQHLAVLRDRYAKDGVMPSYAGICEMLGFGSKAASFKLAQRLTKQGFLRKGPCGRLVPTSRFLGIPLAVDPVRAGQPQAAANAMEAELVTLDAYLVDSPSSTLLIRVRGDSMIEAGILDGDLAVVDRDRSACTGDVVVAEIDGEFTVKELRYRGAEPVLQPRHPTMDAIRPQRPWQVFGVVCGIVRRLPSARSGRIDKHKEGPSS
jgi:SOS regulatory protein LexA